MTTEPSATPDPPEAAESDPAEPGDMKAQFRAALERKRSRQNPGASGVAGDGKFHGTHGAAGGRRVFRRKSG